MLYVLRHSCALSIRGRLSPTDGGSLEVNSWDDATLDDFLAHEYPLFLNEALRAANSVRFMPDPNPNATVMDQLRKARAPNVEIIRKELQRELERLRSSAIRKN